MSSALFVRVRLHSACVTKGQGGIILLRRCTGPSGRCWEKLIYGEGLPSAAFYGGVVQGIPSMIDKILQIQGRVR
jgi:hypothetical protein